MLMSCSAWNCTRSISGGFLVACGRPKAFGADQDSGNDADFDDLCRLHLGNTYRALGRDVPALLPEHIVPRAVLWTFTHPISRIQATDRLTIRTNCPGMLSWRVDDGELQTITLQPSGGVMAGVQRHSVTLGPFLRDAATVRFRFQCTHHDCDGRGPCCAAVEQVVQIRSAGRAKG
jgi:hypothetical protein